MTQSAVHGKEIRDLKIIKGTGLTIGIASGNYSIGGNDGYYAGATNQSVTSSSTNYVQLSNSGVLDINTTGFDNGYLHLGIVVTDASTVTSISDKRIFVTNGGLGLGTGQWVSGDLSGDIDGVNDVFTLPGSPDSGVVFLVLDGKTLHGGGNDYTLSGDTITFVTSPAVGSKLIYAYTTSVPQSATPAYDIKTASGLVNVSASTAPTAKQVLVAIDATNAEWQDQSAAKIQHASGDVDFSTSGTPQTGYVLEATSPTTGSWATPKPFKVNTITTTQTLINNGGHLVNGASLVLLELPVTCPVGTFFFIQGFSSSGWRVTQNTGQQIIDESGSTTTGGTGYVNSGSQYDTIELLCIQANTLFKIVRKNGNPTLV